MQSGIYLFTFFDVGVFTLQKLLLLILWTCIFLNNAIANPITLLSTNTSVPKETIFYASIFDSVCTTKTSYKIDPVWTQEVADQLPAWRRLWDQEGTLLLKTTIKLIDRSFAQQNFQVSLSLCSFPSMSTPLIINTRYALQSFTDHPIPDYVFISTIYHELLHNYIDSFLPKNTPLLKKYRSESKGVLNHLHLFALEKAVYLQLGWQSKLQKIIVKDESLPNNDYKRAWEIVNKKENYKDFISELKSFDRSKVLDPSEI